MYTVRMITKILLTIAVIIVVMLMFRRKAPRSGPQTIEATNDNKRALKIAAVVAVGVMIAGAALWMLTSWRDATEIVEVRVVNSQTGDSVLYQAHRNDIDDRSFRTVKGVRVVLAETERLEVSDEGRY
ncbi:hypothetical protein BOW52_01450 [Solemya elarraichensis gill symbiont]|uniref:Antitermination protein NusG n=2 Tax=Solemya elarraichensis gill symbiont TaxID=1918949 RepID=A0A1T2LCN3_9GAMM|nr:hypothetical protein BOW52_01450 [Solemya elarraichensis gill symbiont]